MRIIPSVATLGFICLLSAPASAQGLPGHFASMSGALLPELREMIKKTPDDTPHGALLKRTDALLRESRLTSAGDTSFAVDMAPYSKELATALGLGEITVAEATVFYQTAARDGLKMALEDYLKKKGTPLPEGDAYKKLFDAVNKVQSTPWQGMTRDFGIKVKDGQKIDFNWQPEKSLVSVTVSDAGTGKGDNFETRLEGEMELAADSATGKVKASAKPLEDPVRPLDGKELQSRDNLRERSMPGKWINENGEIWEFKTSAPESSGWFGGSSKKDMSDEDKQDAEREDKQSRLTELKAKKVYIWKEIDGGNEVEQETFKRLDEKYKYVGEGHAEKVKEEIATLEKDLAAMPKKAPLPVKQHDPIGMKDMMAEGAGSRPVTVTVTEKSGRSYTFDEAFQKGSVITARRTLRQKADIIDLPGTIIDQLIASWNTPEWIRAEVKEDVRTGDLTLSLEVWRLHVTYSGMTMQVGSLHTPWSLRYTMKKDGPQPVSINYIDDGGDVIEGELPYGEPLRVEVTFDKEPEEDTRKVRLSWDGDNRGMTWIDVKKTWTDTVFRSDAFTLSPPACKAAPAPEEKQSCGGGPDAFKF